MMTRKVSTGTLSLPGRTVSAAPSLSSPRSDLSSSDVIDNDAPVRGNKGSQGISERYNRQTQKVSLIPS